MKLLKRGAKAVLRMTNRTIGRVNPYLEQLEPVQNDWLKALGIQTILDIGASDGGYAKKARELFPEAQIISFEALPGPFAALQARFQDDPRHEAVQIVLSDHEGESTFWESEYSGSSSILEMGDLHKEAYPFSAVTTRHQLSCRRLDDILAARDLERPILMKLDVQGAEMLVMRGAPETLEQVHVIFAEVTFNTLYKENALINEVSAWLFERGFRLAGMQNISQSVVDGQFLQADAYFIRQA